jgi:hypothetical protein
MTGGPEPLSRPVKPVTKKPSPPLPLPRALRRMPGLQARCHDDWTALGPQAPNRGAHGVPPQKGVCPGPACARGCGGGLARTRGKAFPSAKLRRASAGFGRVTDDRLAAVTTVCEICRGYGRCRPRCLWGSGPRPAGRGERAAARAGPVYSVSVQATGAVAGRLALSSCARGSASRGEKNNGR